MTTYKTTTMRNRTDLLNAIKSIPENQDFIWDGDEDDRPVTKAEFETAVKKRGRPNGSNKELVSLRLDKTVIAAFRATGKGWQSRINQVLVDFLRHA